MKLVDQNFVLKHTDNFKLIMETLDKCDLEPYEGTVLLALAVGISAGVGQFPMTTDISDALDFGFYLGATTEIGE